MKEETIGQNIVKLRKSKKITQEQLASNLKVERTTISKWENDVILPDYTSLKRLAEIFDIDFAEFLSKLNIESNETFDLPLDSKIENTASLEGNNSLSDISNQPPKSKKINKYLKNIFFILIIIIIYTTTIIFVYNYNKTEIKEITRDGQGFAINSYIISNKHQSAIIINKIYYNDEYIGTEKEIQVKEIQVYLYSSEKVIYTAERLINDDGSSSIEDLLNSYKIYYKDEKGEMNIEDLHLNIFLVTAENENKNYTIDLSIKDQ